MDDNKINFFEVTHNLNLKYHTLFLSIPKDFLFLHTHFQIYPFHAVNFEVPVTYGSKT